MMPEKIYPQLQVKKSKWFIAKYIDIDATSLVAVNFSQTLNQSY